MNPKALRFDRKKDADFFNTLRKRVNSYFAENNISKTANTNMVVKTIFMLSLYFLPLIAMCVGLVTNYWAIFGLWALMGFGKAGVGLCIQHDAIHGAYSSSRKVNRWLGYTMNIIGGNASIWRFQHNVLHHTYSNIHGQDEDIDSPPILRFHPHQPRKPIHRFQHVYVWFLYSLATISWITSKDFKNLVGYKKKGYVKDNKEYQKEMTQLIAWKVTYYVTLLVLPLLLIPGPTWLILVGFLTMHLITGLILTTIFQIAHVMPDMEYPLPNESDEVENNWAVHQLVTTTNFGTGSRLLTWLVGGLNHQVEHHLFSNICHVHYPKLSRIVKETADEFGIPYHSIKTWGGALKAHTRMLHELGTKDMVA